MKKAYQFLLCCLSLLSENATAFTVLPKVAGRDHWSRVFSLAMAGGGLKRGAFYGDADATSSDVARDGVPLADLHTTVYKLMGINADKELMADGARPMEIIDGGNVVQDITA